jgi:hypothetical protein
LLWLATGLVLVVLSAWRGGLNTIAGWLGVRSSPPAVLFAVGLLFVILVLLHYSTVISRLADQNTILAQRLDETYGESQASVGARGAAALAGANVQLNLSRTGNEEAARAIAAAWFDAIALHLKD